VGRGGTKGEREKGKRKVKEYGGKNGKVKKYPQLLNK